MPRSANALINPEMLLWARRNSGYSIEDAAKKSGVPVEKYLLWESGEAYPTIVQLRKIANSFKRPLAVFYLSEVPKDFQPLRDFRRFGSADPKEFRASPELLLEIRKARYRRDVALELLNLLDDSIPKFEFKTDLSSDPELVGSNLRHYLGITFERQKEWVSEYDALNAWRDALESSGVFVFQARGVEIEEMRGFSIGDEELPVVAVNIKDRPRPRIFSMIHELVHICLQDEGICDFEEESSNLFASRTEVFCNMVTGAALVPMRELLSTEIVLNVGNRLEWTNDELGWLSRYFQVSWEMLLRRLLIAGKTTYEYYQFKRREFQEYFQKLEKKKEGFAPPSTLAVSTAGPSFVRLVLDGYYQDKITASDVSEYLGVRLKHLGKIETSVFGREISFGG